MFIKLHDKHIVYLSGAVVNTDNITYVSNTTYNIHFVNEERIALTDLGYRYVMDELTSTRLTHSYCTDDDMHC